MSSPRRTCATLLVALVALVAATTAHASVFSGHSGWFWGSPLPQGNTLRAIDFAGKTGYAVGDFGTVLRTDDRGTTWTGLTTGTTVPLRIVRVVSPEVVVVAGKCDLRLSADGGASFTALPYKPEGFGGCTTMQIRSLSFPDAQNGSVLLADGNVLQTGDGGRTWRPRTAIPGTAAAHAAAPVHPTDIFFTDPKTGYVTAESGSIFRTTDGGTSWSPVATAPQHLDSIYFPDAQNGYAVGGVSVLSTHDGGKVWSQEGLVPTSERLAWVRCKDAQACLAVPASGDQILHTEDGGGTWASVSPSSQPLYAADYSTDNAGLTSTMVAVGTDGETVTSNDFGQTFATTNQSAASTFSLVRARTPTVAYAGGRAGAVARTTDGGRTWSALSPAVDADVVDLSFPTATTGYALAKGNVLTRTDDGGTTWRLLDLGTFVPASHLYALDEFTVVVVMQRGLRASINGGTDFARITDTPVAGGTFSGVGPAGKGVVAYGPHVIALSPDAADWHKRHLPSHVSPLKLVKFVTAAVGYALTKDGRAWRTNDGAGSWHELPALGTEIGADIAFGSLNSGYVAVREFGSSRGGYLMRTTDGGETWRPQLVDSLPIARGALDASTPGNGFALAGDHHLFATTRGGDIGRRSVLTISVTRTRPGKPGVIAINGTLTPAKGGERVVISQRSGASKRWLFGEQTVSSTGRFTLFVKLRRTSRFVAQWAGNDERQGAGTSVMTLGIGRGYTQRTFRASSQSG